MTALHGGHQSCYMYTAHLQTALGNMLHITKYHLVLQEAHPNDAIARAGVLVPGGSASAMLSASPVSEDAALLVGGSTCIPTKYDELQSEYEATLLNCAGDDACPVKATDVNATPAGFRTLARREGSLGRWRRSHWAQWEA